MPDRPTRTTVRAVLIGLPACPVKGCPVRYRSGPDRLCPDHQGEAEREARTEIAELMRSAGPTRAQNATAAEKTDRP